ncbi:uncharacterized protein V6R79_011474 [Siganus canaliculatus]
MSTAQTVKVFVQQRLAAAAEEIFELFERTIAEYEQKLLEARYTAEVRIHRSDDQQEEKLPELLHVKEEQEEVQAGLEGDHGLISGLVSPESDPCQNQEAQPSESDQSPTEEDGDVGCLEAEEVDDGGSQSDWDGLPQGADQDFMLLDYSEAETDYSCYDWDHREPGSDVDQDAGGAPSPDLGDPLEKQSDVRVEGKVFSCPFCGKIYQRKTFLRRHIRLHAGRSRFSCSLCGQFFQRTRDLVRHMKVHEPCGCPLSDPGASPTSRHQHHPSCSYGNNWLDQFQVPWDKMRPALRRALSAGQRPEAEDRRDMVKVVAASMREYSLNPTRKDCTVVVRAMVQKYPESFLDKTQDGDILGCGYLSLLNQLKTRIEYVNRGNKQSRLRKPRRRHRRDQNLASRTSPDTSGPVSWDSLGSPDVDTSPSVEDMNKELVDIFSREALKASEGGDINELITYIQNKVE